MVGGCDFTPEADAYETVGPETRWERKAILDKMLDVIHNELTEKQRTVLLAELKACPRDEIAQHLNSNRNAVYKLAHDARKRLRRGLEAAGYHATDVGTAFAE